MSQNVIDLIKGQFSPTVVSETATKLGESESGISKAISAFLPAVVGGLANTAGKPAILDSLSGSSAANFLGNLLETTDDNSVVSQVLHSIFGDRIAGLISSVADFAGIGNSSAASLLNMVTAASLGSIGRYAADQNLAAPETEKLLEEQKGSVSSLLPAGLSLAALGLGNWGAAEDASAAENVQVTSFDEPKVEVHRAGNTHVDVETPAEVNSIWKWLLPLLLLALAAWFLWKECNKPAAETTTTTKDSAAAVADSSTTVVAGNPALMGTQIDEDIDLNGTTLKGYKGGMEDSMISFLKSDSYKNAADDAALKDTWYTFDKVNFKMNSATDLEAGSVEQLENLVAILKAYPDAKIKIGGYTDKVGDEAANLQLSQQRADFIKKWLTDKGVGAQIIAAEGYGSKFATVDPGASDAERAVDRKMAARFAK